MTMRNFGRLRRKVEKLLEIAGTKAEPALIVIQPDGTRVVIGPDSRHMPPETPPGRGTKVIVGVNHDDI
jgi:hypothetical protein